MAHINVLCGDRGGFDAIRSLLLHANDVRLYVTATTGHQFVSGNLPLPTDLPKLRITAGPPSRRTINDWFAADPKLVVIGSSQSNEGAMAGAAAIAVAHEKGHPALIVEDMYNSAASMLKQADEEGTLDAVKSVCVSDTLAQENIISNFPQLHDRTIITGAPQFDRIKEMQANWRKKRQDLRQQLNISDDQVVFLVVGQLNGTAEVIELIVQAAASLDLQNLLYLLIARHPRATDREKQELTLCERGLTHFTRITTPAEDLLPAADYIGSGYSTTNWWGVLCQMPGVIYFGTPQLQADLQRETGLEKPLAVEPYQAAWHVTSHNELLDAMSGGNQRFYSTLAKNKRTIANANDGHATQRVWAEIEKLLPT